MRPQLSLSGKVINKYENYKKLGLQTSPSLALYST